MTYQLAINNIKTGTYTILGFGADADDIALTIKTIMNNLRDGDIIEITREGEEE